VRAGRQSRALGSQAGKQLPTEDWDFGCLEYKLAEARAACIWEYARESQKLSQGQRVTLGNREEELQAIVVSHLEAFWADPRIRKLCFSVSWSKVRDLVGESPWFKAFTPIVDGRPSQIVTDDGRFAVYPIGGCVLLDLGGEPPFRQHTQTVHFDRRASNKDILEEFRKLLSGRRQIVGTASRNLKGSKNDRWFVALGWLSITRLSKPQAEKISPGANKWLKNQGNPRTLWKKRKNALEFFKKLFWFLPSSDLESFR
jgi:hypothetical protein